MKNKKRKGFTLVELLVVIAILAILATVSIIGYTSFTKKATISNDEAVCSQINLLLQAEEQLGKPNTLHDALQVVMENGYDVTKLTPTTQGYNYVYTGLKDNRFVLVKDEDLESNKSAEKWIFVDAKVAENKGYSVYLLADSREDQSAELEVNAGVDVGSLTSVSSIKYENKGNAQDVVIRTNGGNLNITAPNDHVEHFGNAINITVNSVSDTTYVENGSAAKLTIEAGAKKVVLTKEALVTEFVNNNPDLNISNEGFVVKVSGSASGKVAPSTGDIKVYSFDQLQSLALSSSANDFDFSEHVISLQSDINMTGKEWVPFGYKKTKPFSGTIDGNNKKIIGLSNIVSEDSYQIYDGSTAHPMGLIAYAYGNITIKNLSIECDIVKENGAVISAFIGTYVNDTSDTDYTISFNDCKAYGTIKGSDKIGGFIGTGYYSSNEGKISLVSFKNCENYIDITGVKRVGGFVGTGKFTTQFDNCKNFGRINSDCTSTSIGASYACGGFIGAHQGSSTIVYTFINCENKGQLTSGNGYKCDYLGYMSTSSQKEVGTFCDYVIVNGNPICKVAYSTGSIIYLTNE